MTTDWMLEHIRDWSHAEAVAIVIWDKTRIELLRTLGFPDWWKGCLPEEITECACGAVRDKAEMYLSTKLTSRGSFFVGNATSHRKLHEGCPCREAGYESIVLVPLRASGDVVGVLQLCARAPYLWQKEDIFKFEALSAALGIASRRTEKGTDE